MTDSSATPNSPEPPPLVTIDQDIPCSRCNYNLRGLAFTANCPECSTPVRDSVRYEAPPAALPTGPVPNDQPCIRCSYNLRGLPVTGNCPECGTPVERSLRGDRLVYSDPSFLKQLDLGIVFIISAIAATFVMTVGVFVAVVSFRAGGFRGAFPIVSQGLSLLITAVSVYGYWLLSAPDPAQTSANKGEKPRRLIRLAVLTAGASALLNFIFTFSTGGMPSYNAVAVNAANPSNPGGVFSLAIMILSVILAIATFVAGIVQFFAAMLYIRWLAGRIPNPRIAERAKTYMWLLPVLYVVLACVLIGPLVAYVLYLLLLVNLRNEIKLILKLQARMPA